jgi:gas vesicle structural protein
MTVATQGSSTRYLERPAPSSLADVIDTILDKGLVIDAYVRVSLVGIELLTIDARIVIASVDTYLRFAEAAGRLDLADTETKGLPELLEGMTKGGAKNKTSGALEGAKDKFEEMFGGGDSDEDSGDDEDGGDGQEAGTKDRPRRRRQPSRKG